MLTELCEPYGYVFLLSGWEHFTQWTCCYLTGRIIPFIVPGRWGILVHFFVHFDWFHHLTSNIVRYACFLLSLLLNYFLMTVIRRAPHEFKIACLEVNTKNLKNHLQIKTLHTYHLIFFWTHFLGHQKTGPFKLQFVIR